MAFCIRISFSLFEGKVVNGRERGKIRLKSIFEGSEWKVEEFGFGLTGPGFWVGEWVGSEVYF